MKQAGEQHRENAGQKYAVERAGAANGGDRRAEPADAADVAEVGADQRTEAAGDVGERRRLSQASTMATAAVTTAGTKIGTAMPTPRTG